MMQSSSEEENVSRQRSNSNQSCPSNLSSRTPSPSPDGKGGKRRGKPNLAQKNHRSNSNSPVGNYLISSPNRSQENSPHPCHGSHQSGTPRTPPPNRDPSNERRPHSHPQHQHHHQQHLLSHTPPPNMHHGRPPDLTVIVYRVDLFDSGHNGEDYQQYGYSPPPLIPSHPPPQVCPYRFLPPLPSSPSQSRPAEHAASPAHGSVSIWRIPFNETVTRPDSPWLQMVVIDPEGSGIPSPFDHSNRNLNKYWNQRRRLFSRFDAGIQLDEEGWFSVTPEQIADHVAMRFYQLLISSPVAMHDPTAGHFASPIYQGLPQDHPQQHFIILDAFCGCGGNSIAFAKLANVTVVAVDLDRNKLRNAAHNAYIYNIPTNKIVFIECNVLFLLEHVYRNGIFTLDQPINSPEAAMALMNAIPPPVQHENVFGYQVGGIDLLPRSIDAVFMDPPWGGVDYEVFGKNGYDLQRNMKIARPSVSQQNQHLNPQHTDGSLDHDFFDSFQTAPRTKEERRAQFNCGLDDANCVNGTELLALAASATRTHWVIYDVPRNTNKGSLGQSALAAGYRGNLKLEEHYLNGRLKTVTAYLGSDWSSMVQVNPVQYSGVMQPQGQHYHQPTENTSEGQLPNGTL